MHRRIRLPVLWLLLAVLPWQPLTAAFLDLLGPVHVHLSHDRDHDHHDDHDHDHDHDHGPFDRHRHAADDASVVTLGDDDHDEARSGWSGTLCVALPSTGGWNTVDERASTHPRPCDDGLSTRFTGPIERPPRLLSA